MKKIFTLLFLVTAYVFAKPVVTTSILPTKYFVEQIAGDTLSVNAMVTKGADPHTYEPKPAQMKALENSVLYFAVGIEFENTWLEKFNKIYPKLNIIATQNGIEKIPMQAHSHHDADHHAHHHANEEDHHAHKHEHDEAHQHEHNETGHNAHHEHSDAHVEHNHAHHEHNHSHEHHHHSGLDPHIWLDPMLVKIQAQNITNALISAFPENKALYSQNLAKFSQKLDELDKFIQNTLKSVKNRSFIVYHPSWGYFAKRYDLHQIPIEIEGKEPKPADLAHLIEEAKEHSIKVIFVAPQFSKKAANQVAKATGAKVVEIDQLPLNWESELRKTTEIFAKSL